MLNLDIQDNRTAEMPSVRGVEGGDHGTERDNKLGQKSIGLDFPLI